MSLNNITISCCNKRRIRCRNKPNLCPRCSKFTCYLWRIVVQETEVGDYECDKCTWENGEAKEYILRSWCPLCKGTVQETDAEEEEE